MSTIYYREGFKYQLSRDYYIQTGLTPPFAIVTEYIGFDEDGTLSIAKGYAWDGPSGPTFDTPCTMRASLVHDALYQLMRANLLNPAYYREAADKLFHRLCLEDEMNRLRAELWYESLRVGAGAAADPKNEKREIAAPKAPDHEIT